MEELLRTEERRIKRHFRRAMANLPDDEREAVCGVCGDMAVPRSSRIKCSKCNWPICEKCFEKEIRIQKTRFVYDHAYKDKGCCYHPKHPNCFTRLTMAKIRKDAIVSLECEVCDNKRQRQESQAMDDMMMSQMSQRPLSQPPSPTGQAIEEVHLTLLKPTVEFEKEILSEDDDSDEDMPMVSSAFSALLDGHPERLDFLVKVSDELREKSPNKDEPRPRWPNC